MTRGGATTEYTSEPTLDQPSKRECVAASPWPPLADDGGLQRRLAERYSGASSVRPPAFFRDLAGEARRAIRATAPGPVDFDRVPSLADVAGWLPQGVDPDGWARRRFSVEAPETGPGMALVFTLLHPLGERSEPARWTLSAGSSGAKTFDVEPGYWRLAVPVGRLGSARRIGFESDRDHPLPGQDRRRALRILRIELGPAGRRPQLERLPG